MKITRTLICLLAGCIFLISVGCNGQSGNGSGGGSNASSSTPLQQWKDWVNLQETIGRTVVDVTQSQQWLAEHPEIPIPDKIGFLEQHLVMEQAFVTCGIMITTDHNGKRRVVAREWPCPPTSDPYGRGQDWYVGFMTAEESKTWLRNNHFQVQKNAEGNGYIIICNYYDPGPPSTRYNTRTEISDRGMASISGPTSALATIDVKGQLRVAPSGTQQ